MALRSDELKKSTGSKKAGRGSLEPLEEGGGGGASNVSQVGEMGELLDRAKIDSSAAKAVDRENLAAAGGVAAIANNVVTTNPSQSEAQKGILVDGAVKNTTPDTETKEMPIATEDSTARIPIMADSITGAETQEAATPAEPVTAITPDHTTSTDSQPIDMADQHSTGSWKIVDWHYIAEGGANLVFGYHGRNPEFRNEALRIPKSLDTRPDDNVSDISILWRDELLPKLIPNNHLPCVKPVSLDGEWVAGLVEHSQDTRPDFRADIDLSTFSSSTSPIKATLMDDLRASSSDVSHTVLAIEIKVSYEFHVDDLFS